MKYRTVDQGKYWEVHDWERGFYVATAIPDQAMADAMAGALNGSLTADRDRWKALAVEAGKNGEAIVDALVLYGGLREEWSLLRIGDFNESLAKIQEAMK